MIERLTWELRYYLSKVTIYRKHKGGKWYKVIPVYGGYSSYWINRNPLYNEKIIQVERW